MKHLMYVGIGFCMLALFGALLTFALWAYTLMPENYQYGFWMLAWTLFMSYIFGYLTYETYIKHRLEKKND